MRSLGEIEQAISKLSREELFFHYRAVAVQRSSDYVWFWIGHHSEYDRIIQGSESL